MRVRAGSRRRRSVLGAGLACLAVAGAVAAGPSPEETAAFTAGAAGIGDPYFPADGNGGYDVADYDLAVRYDPLPGLLRGVATITATATQNLSRFDFDLTGLTVREVTVDGAPAGWERAGQELIVEPATGLAEGGRFTVVVRYDGVPDPVLSGSGARGFARTVTGAVFAGQPHAATTWFPVNDHPLDRATYTVRVDVPTGLTAVSNGALRSRADGFGRTVWTWRAGDPMASYLSLLVIGDLELRSYSRDGVRYWDAVDRLLGAGFGRDSLNRQPGTLEVLASMFGPYPYATGGAVVHSASSGFALETQTRPVYAPQFFTEHAADTVIVHELAHQWFGDDLTIAGWRHIWLNEGFATYAQWLVDERDGVRSADAAFGRAWRGIAADAPFWTLRIGDPGPENLFRAPIYTRGAMTLHQLRRVLGDATFFRVVRSWASQRAGTNVTTAQFIAHAEKVAGRDLDGFFRAWLFTGSRPCLPGPGGPPVPR